MPRRSLALRRCALLAATALLLLPGAAWAGVFPAEVVDGPTPELVSAGDLDVARDGTGAVAYLKREEGVAHVFVSRLVGGSFLPPERVDTGLADAAAEPVVAVADGGRVAVAFVSGTRLHAVIRPTTAAPFGAPQPVADGASRPDVDMSINGVGYLSFTAAGQSAADIRAARLARDASAFTLLPDLLDISAANDAGDGSRRSKVAVSADGTAVIAWGEADHVYARRVFGTRISAAPQDLNVATLEGHAGGAADLVEIDIEDDSSYAWATFRQRFDDGRAHVVARRLIGSSFEAPVLVDGLGFPAPADAAETALELNGRGEGIAVTAAGPSVNGAIVHRDAFTPGAFLGAAAPISAPAVAIAENNDAFAAWLAADGSVQLRTYDIRLDTPQIPPPAPGVALSRPEFGPVVTAGGMDLSVNRVGDAAAVFLQEQPEGRRLVAGVFDRPPGAFVTNTTSNPRPLTQPGLSWQASFDLLGAVGYRVEIDGQVVGETTATRFALPAPLAEGDHRWRVLATDRRGQVAETPARLLRVDTLAPVGVAKLTGSRRVGRLLTLAVTAADGSFAVPSGSGVRSIRVDWGDKTKIVWGSTAVHRYAKAGSYTITIRVRDVAGNISTLTERLKLAKPSKASKGSKPPNGSRAPKGSQAPSGSEPPSGPEAPDGLEAPTRPDGSQAPEAPTTAKAAGATAR